MYGGANYTAKPRSTCIVTFRFTQTPDAPLSPQPIYLNSSNFPSLTTLYTRSNIHTEGTCIQRELTMYIWQACRVGKIHLVCRYDGWKMKNENEKHGVCRGMKCNWPWSVHLIVHYYYQSFWWSYLRLDYRWSADHKKSMLPVVCV